MSRRQSFRVGDRVRHRFVPGEREVAGMVGTVVKVTPRREMAGGVRAFIRVLWANGYEGRAEDRMLAHVDEPGLVVRGGAS